MTGAVLRASADPDLATITAIYAHHVLHGRASFEEHPPDVAEMARRRTDMLERGLPFLVAEAEGRVLGYAYAAPYRLRSAYRFTLEDSVYVAEDAVGRGVGRQLLTRLVEDCTALGYRQMLAVIGDSGNAGSIAVHERLGFRHAGMLRAVGLKFGDWVDVVLMQRALGAGGDSLPAA